MSGRIETAGAPPAAAEAALVWCHGRGESARRALRLTDEFHRRSVCYLAPEAPGKAWYAGPVSDPPRSKARHLRTAFGLVESAIERAASMGVPRERVVLGGFSQGATVAAEYVAACPTRYGGLAALAGGLLGPDPGDTAHAGDLAGTPVFLGAGEADERFDAGRAPRSADTFRRLGADVRVETYSGLGHAINDAEARAVGGLLDGAL
jgi:phospholipase/carboxylesterase